jgi:serine/threonine-protein kinase HipA
MAPSNLSVYLNDYYVGILTQLLDGRTVLAFDENYLKDSARPTLSLSYKNVFRNVDSVRDIISPSGKLPPFFSNLLPEGKLKTYLARNAGVRETQEFPLLIALSDDLPGAVRLIHNDEKQKTLSKLLGAAQTEDPTEGQLRFSLAGVQLKFSGDLVNSKIVIPARGVGGHWIIKLPSPGYSNVNELEFSMLQLASEIGITVPEFRLVPLSHLENLPKDLPETLDGDCLLSKRFDRTKGGGRIHMEDFAQVFSLYEKYDERYNYQSIANVLWLETGLDDVLEFVRRLVHMFAIGNADMHMKNWALIYPDGRQPKLSPAYDLVSTIVYPNIARSLPHKMAGIKEFNQIGIDSFKNFAQIAKLPERSIVKAANETVDAIKDSWSKLRDELPMPESFKRLIEEHMKTVPLLNERVTINISGASVLPRVTQRLTAFVEAHVELDENVPQQTIVYRKKDGAQVEMQAPRRMVLTLINNQLGELIRTHPDFANQALTAFVSPQLYNEWRKENFIRIEEAAGN